MVQRTPSVSVVTEAEMICVVDTLPKIQAWAAWFVTSANLRGTAAGKAERYSRDPAAPGRGGSTLSVSGSAPARVGS